MPATQIRWSLPKRGLSGLILVLAASCGTTKETQLERVAKDWSQTIRASQLMPVYPLTEDLQPGDVFLVQLPIDRQQELWREKGYLPLDNHLARLDPGKEYVDFYDHSFLSGAQPQEPPNLPSAWQRAVGEAWSPAPKSGFPTYSFSVRRAEGLTLAIPVSGVPIGLGILGSDSADGTVSIKKARTLGVDQVSMYGLLRKWASEHRDYLAYYPPHDGDTNYLRVVTRVYLAGAVDISLRDTSSQAAGLDVGAARPVATQMVEPPRQPGDTPATAVKAYETALKSLNDAIAPAALTAAVAGPAGAAAPLPGGSVRFTSVSARTLSMSETFDPPLVIGYLGFDVAIGDYGSLGPPVPTFALMEYGMVPAAAVDSTMQLVSNARMQLVAQALQRMAGAGDTKARSLRNELDRLAQILPPRWPCTVYDSKGDPLYEAGEQLQGDPPTFEDVSTFRGALITTIDTLEAGSRSATFQLSKAPAGFTRAEFIAVQLAMSRREIEWLTDRLRPYARLFAESDRYTAP